MDTCRGSSTARWEAKLHMRPMFSSKRHWCVRSGSWEFTPLAEWTEWVMVWKCNWRCSKSNCTIPLLLWRFLVAHSPHIQTTPRSLSKSQSNYRQSRDTTPPSLYVPNGFSALWTETCINKTSINAPISMAHISTIAKTNEIQLSLCTKSLPMQKQCTNKCFNVQMYLYKTCKKHWDNISHQRLLEKEPNALPFTYIVIPQSRYTVY